MTAIPPRTGHARLKRIDAKARWLAFGITVIAHIALFVFTPSFAVPSGSRMVFAVEAWSPPVVPHRASVGCVPLDTTVHRLVVLNQGEINYRIPRVYPWAMWHYKEESGAHLQLTISRTGRVRNAVLLASTDNGGDAALITLAKRMRFEPFSLPDSDGIVAAVEVTIRKP